MPAQVNFCCFLMFFSVWHAIWCLKIGTYVLIKDWLTEKISSTFHSSKRPNCEMKILQQTSLEMVTHDMLQPVRTIFAAKNNYLWFIHPHIVRNLFPAESSLTLNLWNKVVIIIIPAVSELAQHYIKCSRHSECLLKRNLKLACPWNAIKCVKDSCSQWLHVFSIRTWLHELALPG